MIVDVSQRYCERRVRYRPAREVIRPQEYDVVECHDDTTPRAFVISHHYAASYPAARFRFLLYRRADLVGAAIFSQPISEAAHYAVWPALRPAEAVDLGRLVLLDNVPGNAESWFIARCFELLRGRIVGVTSCADPVERTAADGQRIFGGHIGGIYQATNGRYLGRTNPASIRLLPDGTVLSNRTMGKILRRERGWRAAAEVLRRWGADPLAEDEDARGWLRRWRSLLTRPLRHTGNHRYTWVIDEKRRSELIPYGPLRAYPNVAMPPAD